MRMKYARKLSVCYYVNIEHATNWGYKTDTGLCGPLWSIRLNCQLMTRLEMMDTLQAQVCGFISAHRRLPDKKMNRETSDAWKSQLNQAIWNSRALKFGSENQLNIHNYLLILFSDLPLIALSGKVTLLRVWLGVLRTPGVQVPDIEECENHRNLRKNKFWKIQCIHIGNGRRALPPLVFEIWHFPIKFKQKMFS